MTFADQYREYQTNAHPKHAGENYRYKFPNGWGASVLRNYHRSYGDQWMWELAVRGEDGYIDRTHPVAEGDLRYHQTDADIAELLKQIKETP